MPVTIIQGDVFTVRANALVVPGNVQPDLGWGSHISERVKKLADQKLIDERKAFGNIPLGNICLTAGTGSGFDVLIHASVLDKYDFNPLFLLRLKQRTSDDILTRALAKTKEIAEGEGFTRVALSAMGAGIGGMPYKKCCRLTFSTLKDSPVEWVFAALKKRHREVADTILKGLYK